MKIKMLLVLSCLLMVVSSAFAESLCENFERAINESIKAIAMKKTEGDVFDKSAPQQTARYLEISHQLQLLQINILLSNQNKCSQLTSPINPFQYKIASLKCIQASMDKGGDLDACNFKTWKPDAMQ